MKATVSQVYVVDDEQAHWYAIYTHPHQEDRVQANLNLLSVQTFYPQIHEKPRQSTAVRPASTPKPLFPGYLFARFNLQTSLHNITFTRGVRHVVRFGACAAEVDDDIIATMQARREKDHCIRIGDVLAIGDQVEIKSGLFAKFRGVFSAELSGAQRVVILHEALNYGNRLVVDKKLIDKVA